MIYPELHALVGGTVPDYRGLFLRGTGGNAAPLGQYQKDSIVDHFHSQLYTDRASDGSGYYTTGGSLEYAPANTGGVGGEQSNGIETRPVNKSVRYLIRSQ